MRHLASSLGKYRWRYGVRASICAAMCPYLDYLDYRGCDNVQIPGAWCVVARKMPTMRTTYADGTSLKDIASSFPSPARIEWDPGDKALFHVAHMGRWDPCSHHGGLRSRILRGGQSRLRGFVRTTIGTVPVATAPVQQGTAATKPRDNEETGTPDIYEWK